MTEYKASTARMIGATIGALLFILIAILPDGSGLVMRGIGIILGTALLGAIVTMARTRIVVDDDEIAIRRFGKWFRANPRDVTVRWTPFFNGIGRGNGWALTVIRKHKKKDGLTIPLSFWRPATINALRAELREVVGAPD